MSPELDHYEQLQNVCAAAQNKADNIARIIADDLLSGRGADGFIATAVQLYGEAKRRLADLEERLEAAEVAVIARHGRRVP